MTSPVVETAPTNPAPLDLDAIRRLWTLPFGPAVVANLLHDEPLNPAPTGDKR